VNLALLTACTALGVFAGVTGLASLVAWAVAGRWAAGSRDAARTARRLFALRVLPSLMGLVLASGLALPAFLLFEPRGTLETPGWTVTVLAVAGAIGIAAGLRRGIGDWWATRRLRSQWMRGGRPLTLAGAPAPAYGIRHPFPVVSVVGILHPRLFVAEQVLEALSEPELAAVLAHETGHVAAQDNLKRIALRLAPAVPWLQAARRLEERWEQATEEAADERTCAGLELAAALVKTARLASAGSRIDVPAAALHRGGALARRVRRLIEAPEAVPPSSGPGGWMWGIGLAAAAGLAWSPLLLASVHALLEHLVHLP